METVQTYYIIAEEGKELIRDGKSIGTAVWLRIGESYDDIENVGKAVANTIIRATGEGKTLHNTITGDYAPSVWLANHEILEDWEEVDEPAIEEPVEEDAIAEETVEETVEQENEDVNSEPDTEN